MYTMEQHTRSWAEQICTWHCWAHGRRDPGSHRSGPQRPRRDAPHDRRRPRPRLLLALAVSYGADSEDETEIRADYRAVRGLE